MLLKLFIGTQKQLAQYDVATMYLYGVGTEQNYEKAAKYFTMAVDQYHTEAMVLLGKMYAHGAGFAVDRNKANTWFEKAAKYGHPEAVKYI